ncbi:DNA phosphorothioation-dependent restriction protein DptH [Cohnella sp. GCM10027633]|uniref:DNA phosphorothioation-dependent restriction protein DptH n=1 Tax=unclassified Cohnella TaxID=2636738 RepID=UPI00364498C1
MSNQFYKYITNLLLDFFLDSNTNLQAGNRYYLQVERDEDVHQIMASFSEHEHLDFSYSHEQGNVYNTFSFDVSGVRLVIANTSVEVNPDFLVTLRNQVGEQKGVWKDTALFSIVSRQLDSISGGSSDLQKEGMPLHPSAFVKKLQAEIQNNALANVDRIILDYRMGQILEDLSFQQVTFFDFEEIFSAISKGVINQGDYEHFGLFHDSELHTYSVGQIKSRLELNRELFDYVQKVHATNFDEGLLERKIALRYARDLADENKWMKTEFTDVLKGFEDAKVEGATVELSEIRIHKKLNFWERSLKDTKAGKRKRHIIVFNPEHLEEVQIIANFLLEGEVKSLSNMFISIDKKSKSLVKCQAGKVNLSINIQTQNFSPTFTKISYKHDQKVSLGCELNIVVLPMNREDFIDFETNFSIDSGKCCIFSNLESDIKTIGDGSFTEDIVEITEMDKSIIILNEQRYKLVFQSDAFNDENELKVNLIYEKYQLNVPIIFRNELPEVVPINAFRIWRLKREEGRSFQRGNKSKLIIGNREYYASHEFIIYLDWEQKWIEDGLMSARIDSGEIIKEEIHLSVELREAYNRFINRFKIASNVPSLTYYDETLKKHALEYLDSYIREIESFTDGVAAGRKGIDLFKLGVLSIQDEILFSPFHPLNIAYQLELTNSLQTEQVENAVLTRLRPESLVPYIYVSSKHDQLYKSDEQAIAAEWITFRPVQKVSVADANKYLAKIIQDKLLQFEEHFAYLFTARSKSPLKINVINIENDHEVVRGILSWMLHQLKKKEKKDILPIEITIYRDSNYISAFDQLSKTNDIEEFEKQFGLKIDNINDLNPTDILRMIHRSLVFYKKKSINEFDYAHISYYRMNLQEKYAIQPMKDMNTGLALQGLYSSVPSMKGKENYKSGFGLKNYNHPENELLLKVAISVNELAANLKNEGNDSYHKGEAIFSRTTAAEEAYLNTIFSASHWVTFIDSNLDLEYFNSLNENLVVIHYNDQYSSSNKYDAITVTNKSEQYYSVIKEFLKEKGVQDNNEAAIQTIKAFNTFNGEWLLRIVGSKGHFSREKLSILSAIKFALAYFDHPKIKWVPISLEEILRVTGSVSLNRTDGIFTAKNLGFNGSHSDDLLLMGIEETDHKKLLVHFFPIEVKIGVNMKPVLEKAKVQVSKTKKLFKEALCNQAKPFTSKFYRYFFAQLYLVNAAKLNYSQFWLQKDYQISETIIGKLLSNEMIISFKTDNYLGDGAVLSFQKNAFIRESEFTDGITFVNLPEHDGYNGLVKSMEEMYKWIQVQPNDLIREKMLSHTYLVDENYSDCLTDGAEESIPTVNPIAQIERTDDQKGTYSVKYASEEPQVEPQVEPQDESHNEPKVEPQDEPQVEPQDEPQVEPQDEPQVEPQDEPQVEPQDELQNEPQEEPQEELQKEKKLSVEKSEEELEEETIQLVEAPNVMATNARVFTAEATKKIEDIRVLIGKAENSNKKIYWEYGNQGLANRHLLISGKSGQGKTYFMQCLLLELSKQQVSSIVVDYTEGFLPTQLEPEFVNYLGNKLNQRIVFTEKFPINPFRRNVRDIGGLTLPESDTDVAERVKSVFSSVYRSLGIQQQNAIYDAALRGMQKYDREMNLDHLRNCLEEDGSNYAKTALSQIRPFIDRQVFSQDSAMAWDNILSDRGCVYVIQLTGYPRDIQLIITEFILWDLWNFTLRTGNKSQPIPIVLDEAQNLDHTEQSPSSKILTEGRKFGWSGWYATQFLKSQLGSDELARLQNASQKIYFAQPEQELSYIASNLSSDNAERKRIETRISNLKKGQCLVHGPMLTERKELSSQSVITVDITSLNERI